MTEPGDTLTGKGAFDASYQTYKRTIYNLAEDFKQARAEPDKEKRQKIWNSAIGRARYLNGLLGAGTSKTVPLGFSHSAGMGFAVPPVEIVKTVLEMFPEEDVYGRILLSPATNEFAVGSYEHAQQIKDMARNRRAEPASKNHNLEDLLRHAYIPIPDPVHGLPVLGPFDVSSNESIHFLTWVKGPLLHDQLETDYQQERLSSAIRELHHNQLMVVAQMTGVWQAYPHAPDAFEPPSNIEELMREYYAGIVRDALKGYAAYTGIDVPEPALNNAFSVLDSIISKLVVDADPSNGNVVRYFDSALRNFVSEVGDIDATSEKILGMVRRSGIIDFYTLWNITRRIDFAQARRPWSLMEENAAHITENIIVQQKIPESQREAYPAIMFLTRQALLKNADFEAGRGRKADAVDTADLLQAVKDDQQQARDIREYAGKFEPNSIIMPWIRKLRQGALSLDYLAKICTHETRTGLEISGAEKTKRVQEAQHYLFRAISELPKVLDAAEIKPVSSTPGIAALNDMLGEAEERIKKMEFSTDYLLKMGARYLDRLQ